VDVLAVVGPTGAGKSDLALDLAESVRRFQNVEIINADAFSLYRGMDIGTAKILPIEQRGIPHHLIDILDPLETSTISDFQVLGRQVINDVLSRGAFPIVVGGSGLYLRALLDDLELPGTNLLIRQKYEDELLQHGVENLYEKLKTIDPEAAANIGNANARRIIRALEVNEITGSPFTAKLPEPTYLFKTITIGLSFERPVLDARVKARVARMRERGLLDEVRSLASPEQGGQGPGLGSTAVRAVGYAELLPVLRGDSTIGQGFDLIEVHTRQLTRKQMTWFGKDKRIKWFDGGSPPRNLQDLKALA
jgi:tRNA dimethylallyltransferase